MPGGAPFGGYEANTHVQAPRFSYSSGEIGGSYAGSAYKMEMSLPLWNLNPLPSEPMRVNRPRSRSEHR
jgi:hypothetical protein